MQTYTLHVRPIRIAFKCGIRGGGQALFSSHEIGSDMTERTTIRMTFI